MKPLTGICFLVVLGWVVATTSVSRPPYLQPCTPKWFSYLDSHYFGISDGEGHGPDLGSREWLGSVEEKAGLPVKEHLPDAQRCQLIQNQIVHHTYVINQQLGWTLSL